MSKWNPRKWYSDSFEATYRFPPVAGRYPNVVGGRWFVRRVERTDGYCWHAWSTGSSKIYRRRFKTHAEAIEWAARVTQAFLDKEFELEFYVLKELTREGVTW